MTSGLLVVDVQNGVVAGMPGRDELVATIARLVDAARAAGSPVVWVQHEVEDLPHGSNDWKIVPELLPRDDEVVVEKHYRSAFGDTGLGELLRTYGIDRLVLVGAQSAFCVDMAGKHALAEGFDVTWVTDGHGNGNQDTADGVVPDATVRALLNRTWSSLRHPGREVEVVSSSQVRW
jgi:nicotinamidase-related amidase